MFQVLTPSCFFRIHEFKCVYIRGKVATQLYTDMKTVLHKLNGLTKRLFQACKI